MKVFQIVARRSLASTRVTQLNKLEHECLSFGINEWIRYAGRLINKEDIVPFNKNAISPCSDQRGVVAKGNLGVDEWSHDTPLGKQYEGIDLSQPDWWKQLKTFGFRYDQCGHHTKCGQLLDDKKNVMSDQYANMRDRMYDADRQEYHFRITQSDTLHARREILPYEEWAPISADHRYLADIGRQLHAEDDEEAVVEHVLGTGLGHKLFEHFEANRNHYRILVRNFETKKNVKKGLDEAVLRNQFE
jgi:hypothetical protein